MLVDTPILEMENLTKIFSRGLLKKSFVLAVDNINLSLNKGDRLAIIGESGMGKTTIARIACLLETPTYGKIKWFGRDIQSLSKK
ncbi:MAG TPA: ATP-binding cassette domain-containing protein, partial [Candidatus Atribacteria bacterium]|nr:ATP-binding cassette domain-containing protein [Candidatus Atribacteria bacterium]